MLQGAERAPNCGAASILRLTYHLGKALDCATDCARLSAKYYFYPVKFSVDDGPSGLEKVFVFNKSTLIISKLFYIIVVNDIGSK